MPGFRHCGMRSAPNVLPSQTARLPHHCPYTVGGKRESSWLNGTLAVLFVERANRKTVIGNAHH